MYHCIQIGSRAMVEAPRTIGVNIATSTAAVPNTMRRAPLFAAIPHNTPVTTIASPITVRMSTPGSLAASSLKRLVCASQTGVSSDGTTLMIRTL